jgi:hypothetical protein
MGDVGEKFSFHFPHGPHKTILALLCFEEFAFYGTAGAGAPTQTTASALQ